MEGITGKWTNKLTGEVINVRDSIIDGDDMIIISDKGNLSMLDFSQNYIQISAEVYENSIQYQPINYDNDINEIDLSIKPDNEYNNMSINTKVVNDDYTVELQRDPIVIQKNNEYNSYEENSNLLMIDKLFKKIDFNPVINIEINPVGWPQNQLKMLIDIYDVTPNEIAQYLIREYIHPEYILEQVSKYVNDKLSE